MQKFLWQRWRHVELPMHTWIVTLSLSCCHCHVLLFHQHFFTILKLGEDDTCTFCKTHKEDLSHLFWTCEKTTDFWTKLKFWLINCKAVPEDYDQNIATVLGLRPDKTKFKKHKFLAAECKILCILYKQLKSILSKDFIIPLCSIVLTHKFVIIFSLLFGCHIY